jgi:hypothetical protein
MTDPTDLQELDRQLTRIAYQAVIHQAASMLNADCLADADGYMVMGADEILFRPDESIASAAERYGYQRHCCCRDLGIAHDDLTLLDCLRWICAGEGEDQYEDEDDAVSLDEVLTVAGLRPI